MKKICILPQIETSTVSGDTDKRAQSLSRVWLREAISEAKLDGIKCSDDGTLQGHLKSVQAITRNLTLQTTCSEVR